VRLPRGRAGVLEALGLPFMKYVGCGAQGVAGLPNKS
jgi:hypothetical protein